MNRRRHHLTLRLDPHGDGKDLRPGHIVSATAPGCRAVVVDRWGRAHGLGDVTTIGRDPVACDIAVLSDSVSRRHAEVRWTSARRFVLVDLGSTNGTRLDGQDVLRAVDLRSGQVIEVGGVALVFALCAPGQPRP